MSKGKVLVAMSGGVDSSVAAILLKEQGYEIVGITMKTWGYDSSNKDKKNVIDIKKETKHPKKVIGCCDLNSINDAREVAVRYGFSHMVLDIRREFGNHVIDNFKSEYLKGRTPNPCVLCNTHIKWEALLERANMLECDFIATGHYAKVIKEDDRYFIRKGIDLSKDQSYALWGLSQESLSRTLFPLGDLTKKKIKEFAYNSGFEDIAKKPESYEICFIPDNDYRGFLKKQDPSLEARVKDGDFILDGKVVGKHRGYPFYTVGQRRGLDVALGFPVYVTKIDSEKNEVFLNTFGKLCKEGMIVSKLNMMKYPKIDGIKKGATTKVRYNDIGMLSDIEQQGDTMKVFFKQGVNAIAPGQAAVFYDNNNDVIGGGWIDASY